MWNSNSKLVTKSVTYFFCFFPFFFLYDVYNFCSASECGDTEPVSTTVISGDEGGPSSSEEDVLVDDEEELPRSCVKIYLDQVLVGEGSQ